jgi:hypothetical protein
MPASASSTSPVEPTSFVNDSDSSSSSTAASADVEAIVSSI